jgi:hypothetical protein
MPNRVTGTLLLFFALAATSFVVGIFLLRGKNDLGALLSCAVGALALRALHQAARASEGGK